MSHRKKENDYASAFAVLQPANRYSQSRKDAVEPGIYTEENIHDGIANEHRGQIWWQLTNAAEKQTRSSMSFSDLLEKAQEQQKHDLYLQEAIQDIEKDLYRTFPNATLFQQEHMITELRRVLMAYSVRNPVVGYCQSMNFIAALLLVYMEHEEAFWTMSVIIENIVPLYYTKCMAGSHTDERVFMDLVRKELSLLSIHLEDFRLQLAPLTFKWFLCLYVNSVPLETTLRIWDCLFYEGSHVLFRVGLSLLQVEAPAVVQAQDPVDLYEILRYIEPENSIASDSAVAIEQFCNLVLRKAQLMKSSVSMQATKIEELRQHHRKEVEREIEWANQRRAKRENSKRTHDPPPSDTKRSRVEDLCEYDFLEDFYAVSAGDGRRFFDVEYENEGVPVCTSPSLQSDACGDEGQETDTSASNWSWSSELLEHVAPDVVIENYW